MRAFHLSRCRGYQQRIESCNLNPEKRKVSIEHSITHKSWSWKICLVLRYASCYRKCFSLDYSQYLFAILIQAKYSTILCVIVGRGRVWSNCKFWEKKPSSSFKSFNWSRNFSKDGCINWNRVTESKQTLIHCQNLEEMLYRLVFGQGAFWNS